MEIKKPPDLVGGGFWLRGHPFVQARHSPDRDFVITEIRIMEMGEMMAFM